MSAGKIVKWGSIKKDFHKLAVKIEELCRRYEVKLETFWISRESREIEFCDAWSKEVDCSDHWLSDGCFRELCREFGPFCTDYFA